MEQKRVISMIPDQDLANILKVMAKQIQILMEEQAAIKEALNLNSQVKPTAIQACLEEIQKQERSRRVRQLLQDATISDIPDILKAL